MLRLSSLLSPVFGYQPSCPTSLMRLLLRRTSPRSTRLRRVRYYWDSDPCQRSPRRQVSPLATCHVPIVPSSTTLQATASLLCATTACCVDSRLRHFSAGSPPYPAETGSLSYGPTVRFRLLPTPPHDDAVTFSYGAVANSDRDLHPASSTSSRAYTKPLAR